LTQRVNLATVVDHTGLYRYRQEVEVRSFDQGGVQKDSAVPIYSQVERIVMDMIDSGRLSPGQRAPSERQIAETLGISRMTARAAMSSLVADGYLYSVPGKGTFVANPKMRQDLLELTSFTEDMRKRGLKPGARLLELGVTNGAPEKIYGALGLSGADGLLRIHRLRTADEEPMCLETSYLPKDYATWLFEEDLESGSLYRLLESHGVELVRAEEHLEATLVRETESELLTVPVGYPALLIERTTYTEEDKAIEFVKALYRGDRYRFSAMLFKRRPRRGGLL
jgi:GntR family transcriptional regulator